MEPVETPQLSKTALSTGISGEILTRWAISTMVYSEKLETKKKWWISSPIESLNLEAIPYRRVFDTRSSANLVHQLPFEDLQSLHSSQWGWNTGNTTSPCLNPSTCSPMLSTKLDYNISTYLGNFLKEKFNILKFRKKVYPTASCPRIRGNLASGPWKI